MTEFFESEWVKLPVLDAKSGFLTSRFKKIIFEQVNGIMDYIGKVGITKKLRRSGVIVQVVLRVNGLSFMAEVVSNTTKYRP